MAKNFKQNKKGWLRIIEAFIAIILILGVLIAVYSRVIEKPKKADYAYNLEKSILDEISMDSALRDAVLNGDATAITTITNFVRTRIKGFNFEIKICELEDICSMNSYKKEVYATERIISSTLEKYQPKKLKIFMWLD